MRRAQIPTSTLLTFALIAQAQIAFATAELAKAQSAQTKQLTPAQSNKLQSLTPKLAPLIQIGAPPKTAPAKQASSTLQPAPSAAQPASSVAQTVHASMPITLVSDTVTRYSVGQIGHMVFRNAIADVGGTAIAIKTYPDFRGGQTVLTGAVLKSESDDDSHPGNLTGLVMFTAGDALGEFSPDDQFDLVFTPSGAVEGKITLAANNSISVATKSGAQTNVHIDSILYVRSPRCFTFQTAGGSGLKPAMTFKPTSQSRSFSMSSVVPHADALDDEKIDVHPEGAALINQRDPLSDHPMIKFMDKLSR